MNFANFGSDLLREIIPLYGVALVLFICARVLRRTFGKRDRILTLGIQ